MRLDRLDLGFEFVQSSLFSRQFWIRDTRFRRPLLATSLRADRRRNDDLAYDTVVFHGGILKNSVKTLSLTLLLLLTPALWAQGTKVDLKNQAKNFDMSAAASTKPFKSVNSLPATCGAGDTVYLTTAPNFARLYVCTATNTWTAQTPGVSFGWWPFGFQFGGSSALLTGTANMGVCHAFSLPVSVVSSNALFEVKTQSGTGCTGGTCGMLAAVYNNSRNLVGVTEIGTSGNANNAKNINTTGVKKLAWSSGSSVSGGTLSLAPGGYFLCYTTDSAVLAVSAVTTNSWMLIENEGGGSLTRHGWVSTWSTGNGAGLTAPSTIPSTFGGSTNAGSELALIYLAP